LHDWAQDGLLGEVTLVVGGAPEPQVGSEVDLASAVASEESSGLDRRTAITTVARAMGVPRKVVYQAVIEARG
jgi:16S rRNA (cytidine1402-2'-O)-methyltransferase